VEVVESSRIIEINIVGFGSRVRLKVSDANTMGFGSSVG